MAFEIPEQHRTTVYRMERFEHILIPAGNGGVSVADCIEEVGHDSTLDAGHVTGRDEEKVTFCCKNPGVQPPDRTETRADIRNTPHSPDGIEAPALFRALGHQDDFIGDLPQRIGEPLDECLTLVLEKIFLLPVGPARFPPDKDDGGSQG